MSTEDKDTEHQDAVYPGLEEIPDYYPLYSGSAKLLDQYKTYMDEENYTRASLIAGELFSRFVDLVSITARMQLKQQFSGRHVINVRERHYPTRRELIYASAERLRKAADEWREKNGLSR
jgi:hypothetical protein